MAGNRLRQDGVLKGPPVTSKQAVLPCFTAKVHLTQQVTAALGDAAELIVQIGHADTEAIDRALDAWMAVVPRERIRLAVPLLVRDSEAAPLEARVRALAASGWRRWECADLPGLDLLRRNVPACDGITADWSFYALNRAAIAFLREAKIARRVTSPEETQENLIACVEAGAGAGAVEALVFQLTPLFISQTPPVTGSEGARTGPVSFADRRGRTLHTFPLDGRWITTDERPFACVDVIPTLLGVGIGLFRCDWSWYPAAPAAIASAWGAVRRDDTPPGSHAGNVHRGLL